MSKKKPQFLSEHTTYLKVGDFAVDSRTGERMPWEYLERIAPNTFQKTTTPNKPKKK